MLFLLPFGFLGGSATVLCLGADGHVAIESAYAGSCKGAPCGDPEHADASNHDHEGCEHEENCCGDCTDFTLDLEDGTFPPGSSEMDSAVAFVAGLEVAMIYQADPTVASRFSPQRKRPPSLPSPLESIQTIRLLI